MTYTFNKKKVIRLLKEHYEDIGESIIDAVSTIQNAMDMIGE